MKGKERNEQSFFFFLSFAKSSSAAELTYISERPVVIRFQADSFLLCGGFNFIHPKMFYYLFFSKILEIIQTDSNEILTNHTQKVKELDRDHSFNVRN